MGNVGYPFYTTTDSPDGDRWLKDVHIQDFYVAVEEGHVIGVLWK
jgi:hypothetical protein